MEYNANITLSNEILLCLRESEENVAKDMKKSVAVMYYKEKRLSLGQSAKLAEMSKEDFIVLLSTYNISIFNFENEEDVLEDIKNA